MVIECREAKAEHRRVTDAIFQIRLGWDIALLMQSLLVERVHWCGRESSVPIEMVHLGYCDW